MAVAPLIGRADRVERLETSPEVDAAQHLYERHADRVFAFCLSRLRSREEAEDAVQTTFLYAFRALQRGVRPGLEIAWLITIARNVCLTRWNTNRRRGEIEAARDPFVLQESAPWTDPERDNVIPLRSALAALPEQQRRAILLREWQGLSYREIAEDLGVTQAAVETLIFRARRTMAQALDDHVETGGRKLAGILGPFFAALNGLKSALSGGMAAAKLAAVLAAAMTVVVASGNALEHSRAPQGPGSASTAEGPSTSSALRDIALLRAAASVAASSREAVVAGPASASRTGSPGRGSAAGRSGHSTPAGGSGSSSGGGTVEVVTNSASGIVDSAARTATSSVAHVTETATGATGAVLGTVAATAPPTVGNVADTAKSAVDATTSLLK